MNTWIVVLIIVLYFIVNIAGTYYYLKLQNVSKYRKRIALLTLALFSNIIGWIGFFPTSFIPIIIYYC